MKSKLEAKRRENVGRPKKGEPAKSTKKPQEIRATFIVDPDLLRKVKYISLVEGILLRMLSPKRWTTMWMPGKQLIEKSRFLKGNDYRIIRDDICVVLCLK